MTRRTRSRSAALLAVVVTIAVTTGLLVPAQAQASHRWTWTRTVSYDTGDFGPLLGGWLLGMGGCNLGTVCLGHALGDSYTVRIEDDSGRVVGGVLTVGSQHARPFCGSIGPLTPAPGLIRIYLDAPGDVRGTHWHNGPGCTEVRPFGGMTGATTLGATSGRVHITFTGDR